LRGRRTVQAILAGCALLAATVAAAQGPEERPQIFLEKKVYSETVGGKRSIYEAHTVEKGESLWKILQRRQPLTSARFAEKLREFRRANPEVSDPSRLAPGQKILVPAGGRQRIVEEGRAVAYEVKRGDSLSAILASRDVPRSEWRKYFDAVREINPSVRDVDLIYANSTLLLPTEGYFAGAPVEVAAAERGGDASGVPPGPEAPKVPEPAKAPEPPPTAAEKEAPPLTRDVPPAPGQGALASGKPQAELQAPKARGAEAPIVETGKRETAAEAVPVPASFPYRGLLSDLVSALGETWIESGTLYLPLPAGGEIVLRLADFPIVKFPSGLEALVDFGGGVPPRVRDAITANWRHMRIVSLGDVRTATDAIDRLLTASGYYSVKEGIAHPVVIGESISVILPAQWIVQRTEDSLLSGDLVLVKETPEKPDAALTAVLRYARRVGVRVLPFSDDPGAREGFLVGLGDEDRSEGTPVAVAVPEGGGLPAVDFGISFLGLSRVEEDRLRVGGKANAFQLIVQPERVFEKAGRKYVVDTGKMSPAVRTILRDSGYTLFTVGQKEPGREIFERLAKIAGGTVTERREYLIAGGGEAGFSVRITGAFISLPAAAGEPARTVVLVRGRVHSATRALLRDLGVEIVEW